MVLIDSEVKIFDLKIYENCISPEWVSLCKAVVDVDLWIMEIWLDMHADEEEILLSTWSEQGNLWWINLYLDNYDDIEKFIEFDSMINLRPRQDNFSRWIEDKNIRKKIIKIVYRLIKK